MLRRPAAFCESALPLRRVSGRATSASPRLGDRLQHKAPHPHHACLAAAASFFAHRGYPPSHLPPSPPVNSPRAEASSRCACLRCKHANAACLPACLVCTLARAPAPPRHPTLVPPSSDPAHRWFRSRILRGCNLPAGRGVRPGLPPLPAWGGQPLVPGGGGGCDGRGRRRTLSPAAPRRAAPRRQQLQEQQPASQPSWPTQTQGVGDRRSRPYSKPPLQQAHAGRSLLSKRCPPPNSGSLASLPPAKRCAGGLAS